MWYIYTIEYYSAIKKSKIMPPTATWMQLEIFILSEVRKRQIPYDITYMRDLKYGTNEPIYRQIMAMETRLVVAKGEREGAGWIGNLGLIDADYCLWNGLAMRSCCVALRTV